MSYKFLKLYKDLKNICNLILKVYAPNTIVKIEQIEPNIKDFQLHFEISEVTFRNNDKIQCRIVDDTGIVDAYFDRFGNKLDKGGVYLMTHLNCAIVGNRLRVEMR